MLDDLLPYAVGFTTVFDLWSNLAKQFVVISWSQIIQLKTKLQLCKKGALSIANYLHSIKVIADTLAASGNTIEDASLLPYTLNDLPLEYAPFVTSIRVSVESIMTNELHALL